MNAVLGRQVRRLPHVSQSLLKPFSQAYCSSEAQDTLVWPPPELEDNAALQKLLQARRVSQKQQNAMQSRDGNANSESSTSSKQQSNAEKQPASQAAAQKPAGRVTELVRGLLGTRSIEMARMDRDSIENLRVVDLKQLLAVLSLPQRGLKSSLVDRAWEAAKQELATGWRTEVSRNTDSQLIEMMQAVQPTPDTEVTHAQMPFSRVVTGSEVAEMLKEARADNVKVLDVRPRQCDFTDEMVLATARSKLHCQTAAQAVVYRLKQCCKEIAPGIPPRIEGMGVSHHANADWLVVDCGSVVVHIFDGQEARANYNLESLWAAPKAKLEENQISSQGLQSVA